MATKRKGERYWGEELHVPLSPDGQVSAYVWPLRILTIRERGCGGPTIGVQVGNEEILRFDCHADMGHWHSGGYDRLGSPGNSQRPFPQELTAIPEQVAWSLRQIRERAGELLSDSEQDDAAQTLDSRLVECGMVSLRDHLEKTAYLRGRAISENLIAD